MKKFLLFGVVAALGMAMTSCSDNKNNEPPVTYSFDTSVCVLNQGNYYNGVDGSLNVWDLVNNKASQNVFKNANGRSLGDTPQCGECYGSKIYIGMYESNTIEILDKDTYKSIKQIKLSETGFKGQQPRSMVVDGGYVYVAMYDGYVARLDTVSLAVDASVQVGPNPEIMVKHNGKLYVPNSDGMNYPNYGNTASVIDLNSFRVMSTITVGLNPYQFFSTDGGLYVLCKGNYADVASKLYRFDSDNKLVEVCDATLAGGNSSNLLVVNDPYYGAQPATYSKVDAETAEVTPLTMTNVDYPNQILFAGDRIYIASYVMNGQYPSYDLPGYVSIFDLNLNFLSKFNVGSGPAWMFVTYSYYSI